MKLQKQVYKQKPVTNITGFIQLTKIFLQHTFAV